MNLSIKNLLYFLTPNSQISIADIILNVNLWEDEDEKNNRTTDIKTKAVKRK